MASAQPFLSGEEPGFGFEEEENSAMDDYQRFYTLLFDHTWAKAEGEEYETEFSLPSDDDSSSSYASSPLTNTPDDAPSPSSSSPYPSSPSLSQVPFPVPDPSSPQVQSPEEPKRKAEAGDSFQQPRTKRGRPSKKAKEQEEKKEREKKERELLPSPFQAFENAYSSSRFDILRLLAQLPSRPNPRFALGRIDLSCAFVVTDPSLPDNPIIYVSPSFEKLTKYRESEILGRNCRFLQVPGGNLKAGAHRTYCDHETIVHMKRCLDEEVECQAVILNYTKAGVPFLNLITMIPIRVQLEDSKSHLYVIGLQCDIGAKMMSHVTQGPTTQQVRTELEKETPVPVTRTLPKQYPDPPPNTSHPETLQEIRPSNLAFLKTINHDTNPGDPVEFVCQLSMDAVFLYASPGCGVILGFSPEGMVGRPLSEFLHPGDVQTASALHTLLKGSDQQTKELLKGTLRFKTRKGGYVALETKFDSFYHSPSRREIMVLYANPVKGFTPFVFFSLLASLFSLSFSFFLGSALIITHPPFLGIGKR